MPNLTETLSGTGVALVTPFNSSMAVDEKALARVIEFVIDGGVEYIVTLGTTGETPTLSREEKVRIARFTIETVNDRVPVVIGAGGADTKEVIREINALPTDHAVAILSASPYYSKPSQEGIYQHYKAIAENSKLPILLYNVPSRTGANVSAATTVRLAKEFKNIVGIKEASGNFEQINQIMRDKPDGFLMISGDDPISFPMIALGAVGVISVVGNALPRQMSDMIRKCLNYDFKGAQDGHYDLLNITRLCFVEGSPAGVKTALKELGICGDTVRLPLVQVSESVKKEIVQELKKFRK